MSEDPQAVFRCAQCNKPFDKQSTLKRHGYYCRTRIHGITGRARSCIACAKGKTKCDNKRPQCSRCETKAITCLYPISTRKSPAPRNARNDLPPRSNDVFSIEQDPPAAGLSREATVVNNTTPDSTSDIPLEEFMADIAGFNDLDVDFADLLEPHIMTDGVDHHLSSSSTTLHSTSSHDHIIQSHMIQPSIEAPHISVPTSPSIYGPRSLFLRPNMMAKAKRSTSLILSTLKSYPQGMIQDKRLPPFIHSRLMSSADVGDQMEPLSNCLSLVHMLSGGIRGSYKLFWKNVSMECERFRAECTTFTRWELLAAMQALSIYILIRLLEGETEHNNIDMLMLRTVSMLAKQLVCSDIVWESATALSVYGLETSWKEWVFEESRRRLSIVYRVIDMLVYFEPAGLCTMQRDLLLAPLPAGKLLWGAKSPLEWKAASEKEPSAQKIFALAASGDIVQLKSAISHCSGTGTKYQALVDESRMVAHWEEWCSGIDGFGSIVMLAASLAD